MRQRSIFFVYSADFRLFSLDGRTKKLNAHAQSASTCRLNPSSTNATAYCVNDCSARQCRFTIRDGHKCGAPPLQVDNQKDANRAAAGIKLLTEIIVICRILPQRENARASAVFFFLLTRRRRTRARCALQHSPAHRRVRRAKVRRLAVAEVFCKLTKKIGKKRARARRSHRRRGGTRDVDARRSYKRAHSALCACCIF